MDTNKILLVDDVELFLELEMTFFKREDFDLLAARSGREALYLIRSSSPDLVIMDLDMPEMDGDECCRLIKRDPDLCTTPVILVSPGTRPEHWKRIAHSGCDAHLVKPLTRQQLLAAAQTFLHIPERSAPRIELNFPARYRAGRRERVGNAVDLSVGGIFFETTGLVRLGEGIDLDIFLPARNTTLSCRARVAWHNTVHHPVNLRLPAGMGLQFVEVKPEDQELLRALIQERHPHGSPGSPGRGAAAPSRGPLLRPDSL